MWFVIGLRCTAVGGHRTRTLHHASLVPLGMPHEPWALARGSTASVFCMLGTICLISSCCTSAHCSACGGRSALTHVPGTASRGQVFGHGGLLAAWHRGFSRSGLVSAGFQGLLTYMGLSQGQDRAMRLCGDRAQPGRLRHSCYCAVKACRHECCEHTATALATGCTAFLASTHHEQRPTRSALLHGPALLASWAS